MPRDAQTGEPSMKDMTPVQRWDDWNAAGGPKYPKEKAVQFIFRRFPARDQRLGKRALDLGCGSGVHTVFLATEGFETHGTDISVVGLGNTGARLAAAGLQAALVPGQAQAIPYPDGHFDVLLCIGVLECLDQTGFAAALPEIVRVLRPGGCGFLVFASDLDFRVTQHKVAGLCGKSTPEVERALAPLQAQLQDAWMDRYITTYAAGQMQQNEHLVTLVRRTA
jgi:ubiquinone/menaquinone biosynthesis C-methylase UbiE